MTHVSPLDGVRVLELGGDNSYTVAYATRLLADLGADVILVEPPEGSELRRSGGTAGPDPVVAPRVFAAIAAGKRSVVADIAGTDPFFRELVASADVVVDGLGPGRLAGTDLDDEVLHSLRPDSTIVHVSDWGSTGPYRDLPATGLVLQAAAGWVTNRQEPGLPFVEVGGVMHEWVAGSYVAAAVLTGRAWTAQNGQGVVADASVFECIHSTIPYTRLMADTNAELGLGQRTTTYTPFGVRPCRDGWVGINILTGQQWVDACLMTELVEFTDQQQELNRGDGDAQTFETRLLAWLSDKTVNEVVDLGQALRIPVVPVADGGSVTGLPQWTERPFFVESADGDSGSFLRPGPPWRLGRTPAHLDRPSPSVGQHTAELMDELRQPVGDLL